MNLEHHWHRGVFLLAAIGAHAKVRFTELLAPLGLLLCAAVYKSLQVRAAREWPSAAGKVVASHAEVRETRVIYSDREDGYRTEQRNYANIVYEYAVAGTRLRNNRVSIGEDRGNFQVAETIAKYPVGAIVTVHYNPLHPKEAVLERDLPKGLWGCLGIGTAVVLAIVFGGVFGLNRLSGFLSARLADPKLSPLVMAQSPPEIGRLAIQTVQRIAKTQARRFLVTPLSSCYGQRPRCIQLDEALHSELRRAVPNSQFIDRDDAIKYLAHEGFLSVDAYLGALANIGSAAGAEVVISEAVERSGDKCEIYVKATDTMHIRIV